ncbi:hypothetical protein Cni_G21143 [Canna indica]|uniref:non-specific serine/threonine protein kinase n=1 Tax=Canna indica TaxID=4628 RepID=A0AAQ3KV89_9LILI|nr:hypothetical protein Cni_G21143 [Canna indica]
MQPSLPPTFLCCLLPPPSPLQLMDGGTACPIFLCRLRPVAAFVLSLLFLLLLLLPAALSQSSPINATGSNPFDYSSSSFFSVVNNTDLVLFKDAGYSQGALQITPDSINQISYLVNKSGRVFHTHRFKLWEDHHATNRTNSTTRYVASFSTSFSINIFRPNSSISGEGLAFLIASSLDAPPPGSEGGYLGLTNSTLDGEPSNHFVAVELDTFKEPFDPNNNHVGLDINSVNSTVTANLTALGIEIAPVDATNYTVWIDYDGGARAIRVYMDIEGKPKPSLPVLSSQLNLGDILQQYSYFGFAASTGESYQLNCVLAWNLTVEMLDEGNNKGLPPWKIWVIVGVSAAAAALAVGLAVALCYLKRRKVRNDQSMVVAGTLKGLPGTPQEFEFRELRKATNNFDEKMKLGQGGFGLVYRGVLPGENKEVAVKKFSRNNHSQDDFLKELTIINRLRHKHLVPLVGWCHNKGILLLVYDYMPNGSLDQHLYGGGDSEIGRPILGWERRYNIIAGVASAIHYLHDEYDQRVVHRDLKASNVMLDVGFNARLGDFGLARALETDKTSYAEIELGGVPGTIGYIAPECFHTGKATRQSDIFGFGAVVLEVVCGRRPRADVPGAQFLADWVWKLHSEDRIVDAVDARLNGDFIQDDARRLLLLGLACSHPIPGERPKAEAIVQIISRSVSPPSVPLFKPAFMWPAGPVDEDDDSGGETSSAVSRTTMSVSFMASFNYASSSGYNTQCLSKEGTAEDQPITNGQKVN